MKMLNVILNFFGYYILNKQQFLILRHNTRLYSKQQRSGIDTIKYYFWHGTPYGKVTKHTRKHYSQESREANPYPVGNHKAVRNIKTV